MSQENTIEKIEATDIKPEEKKPELPTERPGDIMSIPLSFIYGVPPKKRADRSVSYVRDYIKRRYKVEKVIISLALNEGLWARGCRSHLRRIKVQAIYDEENKRVKVGLPGEELKLE